MHLHRLLPTRIRRRYSATVASACLAAAALTLGSGAVIATHVLEGAEDGAVATERVASGFAGLGLVAALNIGLVLLVVAPRVARSMGELADAAERATEGERVTIEDDRDDDIGRAVSAVGELHDQLRDRIETLEADRSETEARRQSLAVDNEELVAEAERYSEVMDACADGDLTQRIDPQTDDEAMRQIAGSFNRMLSELERAVLQVKRFTNVVDDASGDLQRSAHEIGQASEAVSDSVREISNGANEQSEDLQSAAAEVKDLSATIEEVAATTSTIARESDRVAGLADDGVAAASTAADEMYDAEEHTRGVAETIDRLNEDAADIAESIELIDDIAQQTNMLALNAAIETARTEGGGEAAGDAGGFDVVADEVQELAGEIQEAVDEIQGTIASVQDRASESAEEVEAVETRIGKAAGTVDDLEAELSTVTDRIQHVHDSVEEIDHATNDQAGTVEELAGLIENVALVSADTAEQADRVAEASEDAAGEIGEVSAKARSLDSQSDRLTDVVGQFSVSTRQQLSAGQGGGL